MIHGGVYNISNYLIT